MLGNNNNNNNNNNILDNDINDVTNLIESGRDLQQDLDQFQADCRTLKLKELYNVNYSEPIINELNTEVTSSTSESMPWFLFKDENDKIIAWDKSINLYESIKLVQHYLQTRRGKDLESLSEVKISEWLKPFNDNTEITVFDLYKHIDEVYSANKTYFDKVKEDVILNTGSLTDLNSKTEVFKPLGKLGDTTFNEAFTRLQELNWNIIVDNTKVGINAVAAAVNFVSYTLVLKGYMKYVHNRPVDTNLSQFQKNGEWAKRNKHLFGFTFIIAPALVWGLKYAGVGIKDMISIEVHNPKDTNSVSAMGFVGLFLNKLPSWFKMSFSFLFGLIFVLKLLGYSLITDFYLNTYNWKLLVLTLCSLVLFNTLLHLYLIQKFANKNVSIPHILPKFLKQRLLELQLLVSNPAGVKAFKTLYYQQFWIYSFMIVFLTFTILY